MANRIDMAEGWLVARGGQQSGPYTWEQLLAAALQGNITPEDVVWHPSVTGWVPASEVPGLISTAEAPGGPADYAGAPPRRRGPVALVALGLAVLVVLGGVAAGAVLWHDARERSSVTPPKAERMILAGHVLLPEGTPFAAASLRVLSNIATSAVGSDSAFSTEAAHDPGGATTAFVLNDAGRPILMFRAAKGRGDMEVSAASTARALVLYDPAMLSLPSGMVATVEASLDEHPGLANLERLLADTIRQDPADPLNGDVHPEPYSAAAAIAAVVLDGLATVEESADGSAPARAGPAVLLAVTGSPRAVFAATSSVPGFVSVTDDPAHATGEVTLVNTTFAVYNVAWTRTTAKGASAGKAVLPRCTPWRVDPSSLQLGWPPIGHRLERLVDMGDGQLAFAFTRNNDYMGIDVAVNLAALVLGVGSESLRKTLGGGYEIAAMGNTGARLVKAARDLGALGVRIQGRSYSAALKEVAVYLAYDGYLLVQAAAPLVSGAAKEEFLKVGLSVITRRMAAGAVLGYGAFDLVAEIRAMGDPAIASYSTGGVQLAGIYPFEATMSVELLGQRDGAYLFQATIGGLPRDFAQHDFSQQLQLIFSYGDDKKDQITPNVEAGGVPVAVSHRYQKAGNYEVKVELTTIGKDRFVLASQTIPLDVEVAGDSGLVGDPLAAPFPNGFVQTGRPKGSSHGWTFQGVELQRKGTVEGVFIKYPEGYTRNPLANVNEEDFTVAQGSMPCVYWADVTIVEPKDAVTSWGGPVMGVVLRDEVASDPVWPFRSSPLNEMLFDAKRNLYYAPPRVGRSYGSALLRAGDRLLWVESGYYIPEEVSRDFQKPNGANAFNATAGEGTAGADTQALIRWIQERLGGQ